MQQKNAQQLLKKYLVGECTEEERALLESWYLKHEITELPEVPDQIRDKHLNEIWQSLPLHNSVRNFNTWPRIAVAAMLLLVIAIGLYFYKAQNLPVDIQAKNQVIPGGNKATLTLGNGQKIILTETANGEIATQAGIKILKKADGQLVYKAGNSSSNTSIAFNTIETPKGGQYQVILPDGTKVWLNASSAIKFPASFASKKDREVEVKGEVYFEVAHNKKKPFKVRVDNQQVEVLGTHFNINAYPDEENIRTTLLEGAVKLTNNAASAVLKPGQQGFISKGSARFNISEVDVSSITAWKDGFFLFNGTDLHSLMRQIARWYDVEVVYEPGVKEEIFYGKISRKAELAKVLKILKLGDVHFSVNGRKLTVLK